MRKFRTAALAAALVVTPVVVATPAEATATQQVSAAAADPFQCPNSFWGRLFGIAFYGPSIIGRCYYR